MKILRMLLRYELPLLNQRSASTVYIRPRVNSRVLPVPHIYGLIWGNSYLDQNDVKRDETWYMHLEIY